MAVSTVVVCFLLLGGLRANMEAVATTDTSQNAPLVCPDYPPLNCIGVNATGNSTIVVLSNGLQVSCDSETDGGGWIVIQRRLNASVDFYRNWTDYKYGFGDISGNFWLGNENIHRLTILDTYNLRVDLSHNGNKYFALYTDFRILGEAEKYRLQLKNFSGNAEDGLGQHNEIPFSTPDRDNDMHNANCTRQHRGGWWYTNCFHCDLNGEWPAGVIWPNRAGQTRSPLMSEMKIRPRH